MNLVDNMPGFQSVKTRRLFLGLGPWFIGCCQMSAPRIPHSSGFFSFLSGCFCFFFLGCGGRGGGGCSDCRIQVN
jgi:hypothetical protein